MEDSYRPPWLDIGSYWNIPPHNRLQPDTPGVCTRLTLSSTVTIIAGALLLATSWLTAEKGDKTPLKVSVKMVATYLLILPGLAIIVVVVLFFAFIGLAP